MIRAILITAILVCSSAAFALPCPPKRYACWMVSAAAEKWGADAVMAHARSCGWSELEIKIAKRCLK